MRRLSEELFTKMVEIARSDRRVTFENLRRACDYLEGCDTAISPGSVMAYIRSQPSPRPRSEQVIRNDKNGMLKYVRLREHERLRKTSGDTETHPVSEDEDVNSLSACSKAELLAYVSTIKADRRRLQLENNDLRHFTKNMSIDPDAILAGAAPPSTDKPVNTRQVHEELLATLQLLEHEYDLHYKLHPDGIVFTLNGLRRSVAAPELIRAAGGVVVEE